MAKGDSLCGKCGSPRLYTIAAMVSPNDGAVDTEKARKAALMQFKTKHGCLLYCAACDDVGTVSGGMLIVNAEDAHRVFN